MSKLTEKQRRFADEYIITKRIEAVKKLIKIYESVTDWHSMIDDSLTDECLDVIGSVDASKFQKVAAKTIMSMKYGRAKTNDIIESFAVVKNRNDGLVSRWKKKVFKRDNYKCQMCGSDKDIQAHHISHWSDDPVNRININNGITLCHVCHSEQHPEMAIGLFDKRGDYSE